MGLTDGDGTCWEHDGLTQHGSVAGLTLRPSMGHVFVLNPFYR